jgi:hypothetical protein
LRASVVPAVPLYDGSEQVGTVLGSAPIPDGLSPGASTSVRLDGLTLPKEPGQWLVKFDVVLPDGDTLGRHGVVGPQLPVETVSPETDPQQRPEATSGPVLPPDIRLRPAPGWDDTAWRAILADVVRKLDHDPEHQGGHHHGDQ